MSDFESIRGRTTRTLLFLLFVCRSPAPRLSVPILTYKLCTYVSMISGANIRTLISFFLLWGVGCASLMMCSGGTGVVIGQRQYSSTSDSSRMVKRIQSWQRGRWGGGGRRNVLGAPVVL